MPTITERGARTVDLPAMVEIEQSAFPQPRWASEATLRLRMELNPTGTWIGLVDGKPGGFSNGFPIGDLKTQEELDPVDAILFDAKGSVWLLRNVSVHKKYQGLGLGKLLIQRQVALAREYGAKQFRFTATADLSDYYSAQGFVMMRKPESFHGLPQAVWNLALK